MEFNLTRKESHMSRNRTWIHTGLIIALGILISATPLMAQRGAAAGARGGGQNAARGGDGSNGPRGRGGSDQAEARKQIQQAQQAAIQQANEKLKSAIALANLEAKSSNDGDTKIRVKNEIQAAQQDHKLAVDKARATAKAALAALNNQ